MEMIPTNDINPKSQFWQTRAKELSTVVILICLFLFGLKVLPNNQEKSAVVSQPSENSIKYVNRAREEINFLKTIHQTSHMIDSTTQTKEE